MRKLRLRVALLHFVLLSSLALGQSPDPTEDPPDANYSVVVQTFADVPITFDLGSSSLFTPNLGGVVGVSFYPLPFILEGEGNVDISADLIYRRGSGPLRFVAAAGPRYRVVASDWLAGSGDGSVGIYAGLGVSAGAEVDANLFAADVLDAFSKVTLDYGRGLSEGSSANLLTLRLAVGVRLPMLRISAAF